MGSERFDDEIWDEFRWERHINDIERRSGQLREFITSTWGEASPSWLRLLGEYKNQNEVIDAYIEEELMFEEAYFPEDDDWDDDEDDDPDNDLFMSDDDDDEDDEDLFRQLLQESEEADDADTDEFRIEEIEYLEDMLPYNLAREFGIKVLGLAETARENQSDAILAQFIQTSLQISAKLAAGFSFGFDLEVIGGNITYCKKALTNANRALELLHLLKTRPWMKAADYYKLDEALFTTRNEIGIYIQDLRDTFRNTLY